MASNQTEQAATPALPIYTELLGEQDSETRAAVEAIAITDDRSAERSASGTDADSADA